MRDLGPLTLSAYLLDALVTLAATEPTKDVDITLHLLDLLPMAFCCQSIPLAVVIVFLSVLHFLTKLVS